MSKITTHILDTAGGCPAVGVRVILYRQMGEVGRTLDSPGEVEIARSTTNKDGRIMDWTAPGHGIYKIRFETRGYFDGRGVTSFYPWVDIYFEVPAEGHYHVPLLISPYGYSTYRGS